MSTRYPQLGKWTQTNNSDKVGSLSYSRNINLDSEGYIKLSPRTINLIDDTSNTSNTSDTNFALPVALARTSIGNFFVATTDKEFNLTVNNNTKTISEDTSSNNPSLTSRSHGVWWQSRWHVSLTSSVSYLSGGSWTANAITGLSTSFRHYMTVLKSRNTLCVSNGNVLKQYNTSYAASTDLTIPSDFEITGVAYNNQQAGIITRLGSSSSGQNQEAYFFVWDGATSAANNGVGIGADFALGVVAYKSSFVVLTNEGQLLYWNGGGFDELAAFPFYFDSQKLGDLINHLTYGNVMQVEGDVIYINIGITLSPYGKYGSSPKVNNASGVWCFDPRVGLYHRWSSSNSKSYLHTITTGNIDIATNIFTTSSTIPSTGNPVRFTDSGGIGGLSEGETYYVIKLSSTTFKLASTKALALSETGIDITATGADTSYFWMYDIVDYGISYTEKGRNSGAIATWGNDETNSFSSQDVVFGGDYLSTTLDNQQNLCSAVPLLEARGYFVISKYFSGGVLDKQQKVYIKFKPLDVNDSILVKVKTRAYKNLPTTIPQYISREAVGEATWTSGNTFTTTARLEDAYLLYTQDKDIEIELLAGVGAGQLSKIKDFTLDGSTYTIITEDIIVGATSGLKSYFALDNWEVVGTVTYNSDQNPFGYLECPLDKSSKWIDVKVEMRGYDITVEDCDVINENEK